MFRLKPFRFWKRILSLALIFSLALSPEFSYAQTISLPLPGSMINISSAYVPALLRGMTLHMDNPFQFDFIIDNGNSALVGNDLKTEAKRLVEYFLASMTVPQNDLWVNLSPIENDRIVPDALGKTSLGQDLLAQDYILKQLTATLMYPENDFGKKFWGRIYKQAQEKYGTTDIPTDTFDKVWIMPDSATIYENGARVYVVDARLKVMLDQDHLAQQMLGAQPTAQGLGTLTADAAKVMKEIILPALEQEVNAGKNFAVLRQIYYSLIMAKWYKEKVRNSILNSKYIDQNKVKGIDLTNPAAKEQIYAQYMKAYKKGVYNYIKEEYDATTSQTIPRKYFSGGFTGNAGIKFKHVASVGGAGSTVGSSFAMLVKMTPEKKADGEIKMGTPAPAMRSAAPVMSISNKRIENWIRQKLLPLGRSVEIPIEQVQKAKRFFNRDGGFGVSLAPSGKMAIFREAMPALGMNREDRGVFRQKTGTDLVLFDFLMKSSYFQRDVFPNIRAIVSDMDGTLIDSDPTSILRAVDALKNMLDRDFSVIIVSMNGYENVYENIISKIDPLKRKNMQVFSGRAVVKTVFDEKGNARDVTKDFGERYITENVLTAAEYETIRKNVDQLIDQFKGRVATEPVLREKFPGFYDGYYMSGGRRIDEKASRFSKGVRVRHENRAGDLGVVDMVIAELPSARYASNGQDDMRIEFIKELKALLPAEVNEKLDIHLEYGAAIGIRKKGVGKKRAFDQILKEYAPKQVVYFGDEFYPGGMDRDLADLDILSVAVDKNPLLVHEKAWSALPVTGVNATIQWLWAIEISKERNAQERIKEQDRSARDGFGKEEGAMVTQGQTGFSKYIPFVHVPADNPVRVRVSFARPKDGLLQVNDIQIPGFNVMESASVRKAAKHLLIEVYNRITIYGALKVKIDVEKPVFDEFMRLFNDPELSGLPKGRGYSLLGSFCNIVYQTKDFEIGHAEKGSLDAINSRPVSILAKADVDVSGVRVGLDIGGSDLKAVVVKDGKIVAHEVVTWSPKSVADPYAADGHIPMINGILHKVIQKAQSAGIDPRELKSIGVSVNLAVANNKVTGLGPVVEGLKGEQATVMRDLDTILHKEFGLPVLVLNDGKAAAIQNTVDMGLPNTLSLAGGTGLAMGYGTTEFLTEGGNIILDVSENALGHSFSKVPGAAQQYLSQRKAFDLARQKGMNLPDLARKKEDGPDKPVSEKVQFQYLQDLFERKVGSPENQAKAQEIFDEYSQYLVDFIQTLGKVLKIENVVITGRITVGDAGKHILAQAQKLIKERELSVNLQFPVAPVGQEGLYLEVGQAVGATYYAAYKKDAMDGGGGRASEDLGHTLSNAKGSTPAVQSDLGNGTGVLVEPDKRLTGSPASTPGGDLGKGVEGAMPSDVGGIDMNEIKTKTAGGSQGTIEFSPEAMKPFLDVNIEGVTPVIINVVPVASILPFLGLAAPQTNALAVPFEGGAIDIGLSWADEPKDIEPEFVEA